jgi:hypothetical protein
MSDNVLSILSDEIKAQLLAARQDSESAWRKIGAIANRLQVENRGHAKSRRIPRTLLDSSVANVVARSSATIRQYRGYVARYDDVLSEFEQLSLEQLRLAICEARGALRDGEKLTADLVGDVVTRRCEAASDGFSIMPPDRWKAELTDKAPDVPVFVKLVLRANVAASGAWAKMSVGYAHSTELKQAAEILERLAQELEQNE